MHLFAHALVSEHIHMVRSLIPKVFSSVLRMKLVLRGFSPLVYIAD